MSTDEKDRLKELVKGDQSIIQELYSKTFPKVVNFVLKNKGSHSDAEDIFQKVLLQLIARYKVRAFVIESSFEAYIFTASKNLWRRELNKRKNKVTNPEVVELVSEEREMANAVLEQEKWELFQEKLDDLSDNCKVILKMFFKKIPYSEIMSKMEYSSDNVLRQRIFKCKNKLSELIKKDPRFKRMKMI